VASDIQVDTQFYVAEIEVEETSEDLLYEQTIAEIDITGSGTELVDSVEASIDITVIDSEPVVDVVTEGVIVYSNSGGGKDASDSAVIRTSEALAAGDLVNVWNDSGLFRVRKASAQAIYLEAHGYVLTAYVTDTDATVYFDGINDQVSSLDPGSRFLSLTPGQTSNLPPQGSGNLVQRVGFAVSATRLSFEYSQPILLA
jgi:hypothetical protein